MGSNASKPYQAQLIRAHGFAVPETLITNDPEEVRAFQRQHPRVIYKSISGVRSIVQTLAEEDLARLEQTVPADHVWVRPGGAASIGFHLRHTGGALDRLLLSGFYVVPLYFPPKQWVARRRRIEHPSVTSLFGYLPETWWQRDVK